MLLDFFTGQGQLGRKVLFGQAAAVQGWLLQHVGLMVDLVRTFGGVFIKGSYRWTLSLLAVPTIFGAPVLQPNLGLQLVVLVLEVCQASKRLLMLSQELL